jgi:hypothetical protein
MKKALFWSALLVLGLVLGAGVAVAGDLAASAPQAQPPATKMLVEAPLCQAQASVPAPAVADTPQAPATNLFLPQPAPAAICPLIGCVDDEYCRRDRDCTRFPNGRCNLFCPTRGCCAYS